VLFEVSLRTVIGAIAGSQGVNVLAWWVVRRRLWEARLGFASGRSGVRRLRRAGQCQAGSGPISSPPEGRSVDVASVPDRLARARLGTPCAAATVRRTASSFQRHGDSGGTGQ
jgi:hypothetical protein